MKSAESYTHHSPCAMVFGVVLLLASTVSLGGCNAVTAIATASTQKFAIPEVAPESVGMSSMTLARLAPLMEREMRAGNLPGGAIEIVHQGSIVYRRAFGKRALHPHVEQNSIDTIYDLASMSKAIGTATAIVKLMELGKLRLWDRVAYYDPPFAAHGKQLVTVEELLEHTAGLPSALNEPQSVLPERRGEQIIDAMPLHFAPGSRYEYCNTCFIELAKIVRIVSHDSIADFDRRELFGPVGLGEVLLFDPPARLNPRTSPEAPGPRGVYRRGRFMIKHYGFIGAEGHAGLFGTVDAVAAYGQMLLNGGTLGDVRVLSPVSVEAMTRPHYLGRHTQRIGDVRGLGWDEATTDSSNRGELFDLGGFGHTGSTGCSLWIDPATQTVVVFLSNSAHTTAADDDEIVRLYGRISTIAAAAITDPESRIAMKKQATDWSTQVEAQSRGFDAWAKRDEAQWQKTGSGTRY